MKLKHFFLFLPGLLFGFLSCSTPIKTETSESNTPNILLFITDDQSHEHIRAPGCSFVNTPAMDRVIREGVNFSNAVGNRENFELRKCRVSILFTYLSPLQKTKTVLYV